MSHRSKKSEKRSSDTNLSSVYLRELTGVYLLFLFIVFPLYYEQGYLNIGSAKWTIFCTITVYVKTAAFYIPTFIFLALIGFVWFIIDSYRKGKLKDFFKDRIYYPDIFVLFFSIFTGISCIITPYRQYLVEGAPRWNTGMLLQFSLVVIYFAVAFFWRWDRNAFVLYSAISAFVFLLGVLNRFRIDPLGLYIENERIWQDFLSTIGQLTLYSGYLMTILPVGVYIYCSTKNNKIRWVSFFYLVIAFMSVITQDADSAFGGLFGIYLVLFWVSFRDNETMKRFLEVLLIMLLSWRIVGFLQMAFPESAIKTGTLMRFGSQNTLVWIVIVLVLGLYLLFRRAMSRNKDFDISSYIIVRNIVMIAFSLGVILLIVYIILNTNGVLPEAVSFGKDAEKTESYLIFNEYWGNHRGITWAVSLKTIFMTLKDDFPRFIFGAGPDEFFEVVYKYCGDEIKAFFVNKNLICAHNEWLNQYVNGGLLGGTAYLGIFASSFVLFAKKSREYPELVAVMMCIASYFIHNFFCYQKVTCTPFIFVFIAAGVSIVRNNGLQNINIAGK